MSRFCRVQHVKRRVQLSCSKPQGEAEQSASEEVHRGRAEADRSKGTAMLSALASGGSLNLNQELAVRDCCFKWKQGGASQTLHDTSQKLLSCLAANLSWPLFPLPLPLPSTTYPGDHLGSTVDILAALSTEQR